MRNLQYLQNISSFPHKFIKEQKSKVLHLKGSYKKDDEAREKEIKLRAIFTEPKPKEKKRMFPNIRPKTRNNGADQLKDGELLA
jgi:predicted subunit of tRNA(5-methylaminomethyl-2-thiouridylate) methyltransferase